MAFALQLPLGMLMDEWPQLNHAGFFLGTGLTLTGAVLSPLVLFVMVCNIADSKCDILPHNMKFYV